VGAAPLVARVAGGRAAAGPGAWPAIFGGPGGRGIAAARGVGRRCLSSAGLHFPVVGRGGVPAGGLFCAAACFGLWFRGGNGVEAKA